MRSPFLGSRLLSYILARDLRACRRLRERVFDRAPYRRGANQHAPDRPVRTVPISQRIDTRRRSSAEWRRPSASIAGSSRCPPGYARCRGEPNAHSRKASFGGVAVAFSIKSLPDRLPPLFARRPCEFSRELGARIFIKPSQITRRKPAKEPTSKQIYDEPPHYGSIGRRRSRGHDRTARTHAGPEKRNLGSLFCLTVLTGRHEGLITHSSTAALPTNSA